MDKRSKNLNNSDELMHYGVLGMKWGVRRNVRLLANRRRNESVQKIKADYKSGKITRNQKKAKIKKANTTKSSYITETKAKFKSIDNKQDYKKAKNTIAMQTISEVSHPTLKKGATTVNKFLGGSHALGTFASGVATASVLGPVGLAVGAGGAAAEIGAHYLIQKGIIDKLI